MRVTIRLAICAGLLLTVQVPAHAISCTPSIAAIAFGTVDVLPGAVTDTAGTLSISCSGGAPANNPTRNCASIDVGSAGDATSRKMTGPGGATLRYDLYTTAARTTKWGSWQTGYDTAGVTINVPYNSSTSTAVYARIIGSQQTASVGSYSASFVSNPSVPYKYNAGAATCPLASPDGTATASFTVTATVSATCIVGAGILNFGSSGFLTGAVDASTSLSVQCNNGLPYTVALNGGTASASDPTQRKMTLGAASITYGLYRDLARSLPWGNTTGTNTAGGTGTGLSQSLTVYGRVPAQTTPSPGTYSDTIVATVTY